MLLKSLLKISIILNATKKFNIYLVNNLIEQSNNLKVMVSSTEGKL